MSLPNRQCQMTHFNMAQYGCIVSTSSHVVVGHESSFADFSIESILTSAQRATHSQLTSRWQRLADRYTRLGPWRFAPHLLGSALCDVGNAIKRFAER